MGVSYVLPEYELWVLPFISDYDAVLTEAGDYTGKFSKLRNFLSSVTGLWAAAS